MQRGRQDAVAHGEHGLDEAGDAGGGHGVADHGFDRTDDRRGSPVIGWPAEEARHGLQLRAIAGVRTSTVGFNQTQGARGGRVEAQIFPGPFEGQQLTFHARVHQARLAAVAGDAAAAHEGVDAIAVPLRVGAALEEHQAHALTDQQAVGAGVEGADLSGVGKGAQLAEDAPEGHVVGHVHTTGQHRIAASGTQVGTGAVDGDQGRGAGAVHCVARPLEVEAVGDAAGGQVGHQADDRVRADVPHLRLVFRPHGFDLLLADARDHAPQAVGHLLGHAHLLHQARHARVQVAAPAEDHAGVAPGQGARAFRVRAVPIAGVSQGAGGHLQQQQLIRLAGPRRHGHHAPGGGIELGEVVDEAAPVAVDAVHASGGGGLGVVEDAVPTPLGHGTDGVHAALDVLPVGLEIAGTGEDAGHADDGYVVGPGLRVGAHRAVS